MSTDQPKTKLSKGDKYSLLIGLVIVLFFCFFGFIDVYYGNKKVVFEDENYKVYEIGSNYVYGGAGIIVLNKKAKKDTSQTWKKEFTSSDHDLINKGNITDWGRTFYGERTWAQRQGAVFIAHGNLVAYYSVGNYGCYYPTVTNVEYAKK
ncbi:MAG: hypothetical protein PHT40_00450 [Patescibacteria group bacterium]|nr:hypothetical protein [Patescibacteria group bacterium]